MTLCWRYQTLSRGLQSVLGCKFRMASPLEFNDPFDSALATIEKGGDCDWKEIGAPKMIAESMRSTQVGMARFLCLSKDKGLSIGGDILLWSHYADFGNGIRIGIDVDGLGYELIDMKYSRNRPTVDLCGCGKEKISQVTACALNKVYGVKGSMWSYENEIRISVMLNAETKGIEVSDSGEIFCLIPSDRCRYVDFGPKLSIAQCLSTATAILQRKALRHIRFRRAVLDEKRFKYRYDDFNVQEIMVYSASNDREACGTKDDTKGELP